MKKQILSAVGLFLAATTVHGQDNPQLGYQDSYEVDGVCYCNSNFDHGISGIRVSTPVGDRTVRQVCDAIEEVLGTGSSSGRIPYNDIQCGNGPPNNAGDEDPDRCPGRVDIGPAGCDDIGPRWDLEAVFGTNEPEPEPEPEPNVSPTASFASPANGAELVAGSAVSVTVNASDSDGSIANVVLSLDGNVVRQENASPYEWDDAELQSLSVGAHELTAVATDNDGATTSTSISVEVIAAVVPEPVEPEPVEPEPIDEEPVRPEPVEPDPVEPEPIDEEPVRPEPVEPDPVIAGLSLSFDTPANGATIPVGSDVPVLVTATQSNGDIAEVSLSLNGDLVRIERFEPFSWADGDRNMDPALQDMPAGSYVLIAVATNDAGGSITESVSFEVTDTGDSDRPPVEPPVEPVEPPIANTGPAVSFATPADGATFEQGDTVTVIANATDPDDGIDNVRLSVDGSFVRQENRAPYRWGNRDSVMQNLSVGTHELTLVATDHSGRPASDTISITVVANEEPVPPPPVEPPPVDEPSDGRDLVSLHYDNAPDQDDGHALVAGRVLADTFDVRAMAVNGTYGEGRRNDFNTGSERVFDRAWPNGLDAFNDRDGSVEAAAEAWSETISDGGTVYVADGGPSDFTAAVLREMPAGQRSSVTVVQHSDWNENNTDDDELDFVRDVTNYIRIDDGNHPDNDTADLETRSGEGDFVDAALDSEWSDEWEAAFDYLNPGSKLDFSDTVEFLFILDVPLSRVRDWNDFADEFFR